MVFTKQILYFQKHDAYYLLQYRLAGQRLQKLKSLFSTLAGAACSLCYIQC